MDSLKALILIRLLLRHIAEGREKEKAEKTRSSFHCVMILVRRPDKSVVESCAGDETPEEQCFDALSKADRPIGKSDFAHVIYNKHIS